MADVLVRCPRTGRDVPVGIEMDRHTWDKLPVVLSRFRCPACGQEHVWSKTYARFQTNGAEAGPPQG